MSMSVPSSAAGPLAEFIERHETLRTIMEWIAHRFPDAPRDDSIDWEDGEEHEDPVEPGTL